MSGEPFACDVVYIDQTVTPRPALIVDSWRRHFTLFGLRWNLGTAYKIVYHVPGRSVPKDGRWEPTPGVEMTVTVPGRRLKPNPNKHARKR